MWYLKVSSSLLIAVALICLIQNALALENDEWTNLADLEAQIELPDISVQCKQSITNFNEGLKKTKALTDTQLFQPNKTTEDIVSLANDLKSQASHTSNELVLIRKLIQQAALRFRDTFKSIKSFTDIRRYENLGHELEIIKKITVDKRKQLVNRVIKSFGNRYDVSKLADKILETSLDSQKLCENYDAKKRKAQDEFKTFYNSLNSHGKIVSDDTLDTLKIFYKGMQAVKSVRKKVKKLGDDALNQIKEGDEFQSLKNAVELAKTLKLKFEDAWELESGELTFSEEQKQAAMTNNKQNKLNYNNLNNSIQPHSQQNEQEVVNTDNNDTMQPAIEEKENVSADTTVNNNKVSSPIKETPISPDTQNEDLLSTPVNNLENSEVNKPNITKKTRGKKTILPWEELIKHENPQISQESKKCNNALRNTIPELDNIRVSTKNRLQSAKTPDDIQKTENDAVKQFYDKMVDTNTKLTDSLLNAAEGVCAKVIPINKLYETKFNNDLNIKRIKYLLSKNYDPNQYILKVLRDANRNPGMGGMKKTSYYKMLSVTHNLKNETKELDDAALHAMNKILEGKLAMSDLSKTTNKEKGAKACYIYNILSRRENEDEKKQKDENKIKIKESMNEPNKNEPLKADVNLDYIDKLEPATIKDEGRPQINNNEDEDNTSNNPTNSDNPIDTINKNDEITQNNNNSKEIPKDNNDVSEEYETIEETEEEQETDVEQKHSPIADTTQNPEKSIVNPNESSNQNTEDKSKPPQKITHHRKHKNPENPNDVSEEYETIEETEEEQETDVEQKQTPIADTTHNPEKSIVNPNESSNQKTEDKSKPPQKITHHRRHKNPENPNDVSEEYETIEETEEEQETDAKQKQTPISDTKQNPEKSIVTPNEVINQKIEDKSKFPLKDSHQTGQINSDDPNYASEEYETIEETEEEQEGPEQKQMPNTYITQDPYKDIVTPNEAGNQNTENKSKPPQKITHHRRHKNPENPNDISEEYDTIENIDEEHHDDPESNKSIITDPKQESAKTDVTPRDVSNQNAGEKFNTPQKVTRRRRHKNPEDPNDISEEFDTVENIDEEHHDDPESNKSIITDPKQESAKTNVTPRDVSNQNAGEKSNTPQKVTRRRRHKNPEDPNDISEEFDTVENIDEEHHDDPEQNKSIITDPKQESAKTNVTPRDVSNQNAGEKSNPPQKVARRRRHKNPEDPNDISEEFDTVENIDEEHHDDPESNKSIITDPKQESAKTNVTPRDVSNQNAGEKSNPPQKVTRRRRHKNPEDPNDISEEYDTVEDIDEENHNDSERNQSNIPDANKKLNKDSVSPKDFINQNDRIQPNANMFNKISGNVPVSENQNINEFNHDKNPDLKSDFNKKDKEDTNILNVKDNGEEPNLEYENNKDSQDPGKVGKPIEKESAINSITNPVKRDNVNIPETEDGLNEKDHKFTPNLDTYDNQKGIEDAHNSEMRDIKMKNEKIPDLENKNNEDGSASTPNLGTQIQENHKDSESKEDEGTQVPKETEANTIEDKKHQEAELKPKEASVSLNSVKNETGKGNEDVLEAKLNSTTPDNITENVKTPNLNIDKKDKDIEKNQQDSNNNIDKPGSVDFTDKENNGQSSTNNKNKKKSKLPKNEYEINHEEDSYEEFSDEDKSKESDPGKKSRKRTLNRKSNVIEEPKEFDKSLSQENISQEKPNNEYSDINDDSETTPKLDENENLDSVEGAEPNRVDNDEIHPKVESYEESSSSMENDQREEPDPKASTIEESQNQTPGSVEQDIKTQGNTKDKISSDNLDSKQPEALENNTTQNEAPENKFSPIDTNKKGDFHNSTNSPRGKRYRKVRRPRVVKANENEPTNYNSEISQEDNNPKNQDVNDENEPNSDVEDRDNTHDAENGEKSESPESNDEENNYEEPKALENNETNDEVPTYDSTAPDNDGQRDIDNSPNSPRGKRYRKVRRPRVVKANENEPTNYNSEISQEDNNPKNQDVNEENEPNSDVKDRDNMHDAKNGEKSDSPESNDEENNYEEPKALEHNETDDQVPANDSTAPDNDGQRDIDNSPNSPRGKRYKEVRRSKVIKPNENERTNYNSENSPEDNHSENQEINNENEPNSDVEDRENTHDAETGEKSESPESNDEENNYEEPKALEHNETDDQVPANDSTAYDNDGQSDIDNSSYSPRGKRYRKVRRPRVVKPKENDPINYNSENSPENNHSENQEINNENEPNSDNEDQENTHDADNGEKSESPESNDEENNYEEPKALEHNETDDEVQDNDSTAPNNDGQRDIDNSSYSPRGKRYRKVRRPRVVKPKENEPINYNSENSPEDNHSENQGIDDENEPNSDVEDRDNTHDTENGEKSESPESNDEENNYEEPKALEHNETDDEVPANDSTAPDNNGERDFDNSSNSPRGKRYRKVRRPRVVKPKENEPINYNSENSPEDNHSENQEIDDEIEPNIDNEDRENTHDAENGEKSESPESIDEENNYEEPKSLEHNETDDQVPANDSTAPHNDGQRDIDNSSNSPRGKRYRKVRRPRVVKPKENEPINYNSDNSPEDNHSENQGIEDENEPNSGVEDRNNTHDAENGEKSESPESNDEENNYEEPKALEHNETDDEVQDNDSTAPNKDGQRDIDNSSYSPRGKRYRKVRRPRVVKPKENEPINYNSENSPEDNHSENQGIDDENEPNCDVEDRDNTHDTENGEKSESPESNDEENNYEEPKALEHNETDDQVPANDSTAPDNDGQRDIDNSYYSPRGKRYRKVRRPRVVKPKENEPINYNSENSPEDNHSENQEIDDEIEPNSDNEDRENTHDAKNGEKSECPESSDEENNYEEPKALEHNETDDELPANDSPAYDNDGQSDIDNFSYSPRVKRYRKVRRPRVVKPKENEPINYNSENSPEDNHSENQEIDDEIEPNSDNEDRENTHDAETGEKSESPESNDEENNYEEPKALEHNETDDEVQDNDSTAPNKDGQRDIDNSSYSPRGKRYRKVRRPRVVKPKENEPINYNSENSPEDNHSENQGIDDENEPNSDVEDRDNTHDTENGEKSESPESNDEENNYEEPKALEHNDTDDEAPANDSSAPDNDGQTDIDNSSNSPRGKRYRKVRRPRVVKPKENEPINYNSENSPEDNHSENQEIDDEIEPNSDNEDRDNTHDTENGEKSESPESNDEENNYEEPKALEHNDTDDEAPANDSSAPDNDGQRDIDNSSYSPRGKRYRKVRRPRVVKPKENEPINYNSENSPEDNHSENQGIDDENEPNSDVEDRDNTHDTENGEKSESPESNDEENNYEEPKALEHNETDDEVPANDSTAPDNDGQRDIDNSSNSPRGKRYRKVRRPRRLIPKGSNAEEPKKNIYPNSIEITPSENASQNSIENETDSNNNIVLNQYNSPGNSKEINDVDSLANPPEQSEVQKNKKKRLPKKMKHVKRVRTYMVNKTTNEKIPINDKTYSTINGIRETLDNTQKLIDEDNLPNKSIPNSSESNNSDKSFSSFLFKEYNADQCKRDAYDKFKKVSSQASKQIAYGCVVNTSELRSSILSSVNKAIRNVKASKTIKATEQSMQDVSNDLKSGLKKTISDFLHKLIPFASDFLRTADNLKQLYQKGPQSTYKMLSNILDNEPTILNSAAKDILKLISPKFNVDEFVDNICKNLYNGSSLKKAKAMTQRKLIDLSKNMDTAISNIDCSILSAMSTVGLGLDTMKSLKSGRMIMSDKHPRAQILKDAISIIKPGKNIRFDANYSPNFTPSLVTPNDEPNSNENDDYEDPDRVAQKNEEFLKNIPHLDDNVPISKKVPNKRQSLGIIVVHPDKHIEYKEVTDTTELNNFVGNQTKKYKLQSTSNYPKFLKVNSKKVIDTMVDDIKKKAQDNGMSKKEMVDEIIQSLKNNS